MGLSLASCVASLPVHRAAFCVRDSRPGSLREPPALANRPVPRLETNSRSAGMPSPEVRLFRSGMGLVRIFSRVFLEKLQ